VARIKQGRQSELVLGSLKGQRDWGWAPDYVEGMWMMLQAQPVDDFILATGRLHTVQQLVTFAFEHVGLNYEDYVRHDAALVTSVEPIAACGNPAKAKRLLGWENTIPFNEIIARLIDFELRKSD
jgi:GDPmannose 4,6-dehydratase